jgi:phosphate transport system protein
VSAPQLERDENSRGQTIEAEINELRSGVLVLGRMVEQAIGDAIQALVTGDLELARATLERDRALDAFQGRCDRLVRRMIPLQEGADAELRFVLSAVRMVTDLERMDGLASAICRATLYLEGAPIRAASCLSGLEERVRAQVSRALRALASGDTELALETIAGDRAVDTLYRAAFRRILARMVDDPHHISHYMALSDIAKSLEWIGDHATNIGETLLYAVRGHGQRPVDHAAAAALLAAGARVGVDAVGAN